MSGDQFSSNKEKIEKISIGSLDGGPKVYAQYNPKELEISKSVPWSKVHKEVLELPERPPSRGYQRPPRERFHEVPDHAASLG